VPDLQIGTPSQTKIALVRQRTDKAPDL